LQRPDRRLSGIRETRQTSALRLTLVPPPSPAHTRDPVSDLAALSVPTADYLPRRPATIRVRLTTDPRPVGG